MALIKTNREAIAWGVACAMIIIAAMTGSERYHLRSELEQANRKAAFFQEAYFTKAEELMDCEYQRKFNEINKDK